MGIFLGLDTASANLGVSLINSYETLSTNGVSVDTVELEISKTNTLGSTYPNKNDLSRLTNQCLFIDKLVSEFTISAVALEAPAYSFKSASSMLVSVGIIHGALLSKFVGKEIPFIWVSPTQLKFAAGCKGNAEKKEIVRACRNEFATLGITEPKRFDDNQADAFVLARLAQSFYEVWYKGATKVCSPNHVEVLLGGNGILSRHFDRFFVPENNEFIKLKERHKHGSNDNKR